MLQGKVSFSYSGYQNLNQKLNDMPIPKYNIPLQLTTAISDPANQELLSEFLHCIFETVCNGL